MEGKLVSEDSTKEQVKGKLASEDATKKQIGRGANQNELASKRQETKQTATKWFSNRFLNGFLKGLKRVLKRVLKSRSRLSKLGKK